MIDPIELAAELTLDPEAIGYDLLAVSFSRTYSATGTYRDTFPV